MWSVGFESATVYVGKNAIGWRSSRHGSGWKFIPVTSFEDALQVLVSHGQSISRPRDLFLSCALARPFLVPSVYGVKHEEKLELAKVVSNELTGFSQPSTVWLNASAVSGEKTTTRTLAVAMETSSRHALERCIEKQRWKLRSIRPVWTDALTTYAGQSNEGVKWLSCADTDGMTVFSGDSNEYASVLSQFPIPDMTQLGQMQNRALQSLGIFEKNILSVALDRKNLPTPSSSPSQCPWCVISGLRK